MFKKNTELILLFKCTYLDLKNVFFSSDNVQVSENSVCQYLTDIKPEMNFKNYLISIKTVYKFANELIKMNIII